MRGGNKGDIEANHNFRIRRSLLRFLRKYSALIEFQSRFAVWTNGIVFPQKWGELVCKTMQPLEPAGVFSNRFYGRSWTNCRRRSNIVFLVENTFFTWTESNRTYSMFFCLTFHADRPQGLSTTNTSGWVHGWCCAQFFGLDTSEVCFSIKISVVLEVFDIS